jgi:plastocyanin
VDWLMKEFRDRVLIPTLVPLGALAIIVVVVMNISRVLLALEERSGPNTVTVLAVILSSGILFGFTYFATQGKERSAGSISLMSVAGIMVILAGFVGAEAIHEDEEKERAHAAALAENTKPDLTVDAFDIGFREKELKIGPGKVRIEMVNTGSIAHTFVLDGVTGGKKLSTPGSGNKDSAAFEVAPGTFTYYCDIPGHRQGGMEGKLIVDASAPAPGSGAGGGGAGGGGGGGGAPLAIEGADLKFTPKDATAPAGPVAITLKNVGLLQHNLVIEGHPEFKKLDVAPAGSASGTFDAKPGVYVMYCDIAGHRPAGMEAKLTVS